MKINLNNTGVSKRVGYFSHLDRHLLSFTHEMSSPLTAAQINLEDYLLSGNADGLKLLSSNLKLMEDYLNTARHQIKHQPLKNRRFSASKQLCTVVKSLSSLAKKKSVAIIMNATEDAILIGNSTSFKQIISCVVRNAIESYVDSIQEEKLVLLESFIEGGYLVVSVSDNGMGVENKDKIFEPYYSTKSSDGLGIGLSLATESIREDFDGNILVSTSSEFKTVFVLKFFLGK